jgi:hypothetical protein
MNTAVWKANWIVTISHFHPNLALEFIKVGPNFTYN